jgi:hypothetical protein
MAAAMDTEASRESRRPTATIAAVGKVSEDIGGMAGAQGARLAAPAGISQVRHQPPAPRQGENMSGQREPCADW